MKKKVYGILLLAAVVVILLLTLQDAAGTVKLSEGLRLWLERFGLKSDFHSIRSDAHLVLYFLFGIVLCLYGRECGWRWWVVLAVGCCVGLIDEGIKVLLPTREFGSRTGLERHLEQELWLYHNTVRKKSASRDEDIATYLHPDLSIIGIGKSRY